MADKVVTMPTSSTWRFCHIYYPPWFQNNLPLAYKWGKHLFTGNICSGKYGMLISNSWQGQWIYSHPYMKLRSIFITSTPDLKTFHFVWKRCQRSTLLLDGKLYTHCLKTKKKKKNINVQNIQEDIYYSYNIIDRPLCCVWRQDPSFQLSLNFSCKI